jgi:nucleoside-diphosphate-sugar epimerase
MKGGIEVVSVDMAEIASNIGDKIRPFSGSSVLITGAAGFLGYYLVNFLLHANGILEKNCRIVCVDNFIRGVPAWLDNFAKGKKVELVVADITRWDPKTAGHMDYIIHAASIASPTYYRKFPIETMDANVIGLRNLLDYAVAQARLGKPIKSFLFFSSSEIYGDPTPDQIPTPENFRGYVSCTGPRACYDESKRYGETLCVNFFQSEKVPVKIARPFNNYGPGMSLNDGRVIADFCKNVLAGQDIAMFSDGSPTRTFCYISDAITGYLLLLLSGHDGEPFNIGVEKPEISIKDFAELVAMTAEKHLALTKVKITTKKSSDDKYLVDNPERRCPTIKKARELLGYDPKVGLEEGLRRVLTWYKHSQDKTA